MHRLPQFLVLAFVGVSVGVCTRTAAANLSRGPYLQQATPDSVVVVWRTEGASTPVLRFGSMPGAPTTDVKGDAITLRVSADVPAPPSVSRLYNEPANEVTNREADHDPSTNPNTFQYEARVSGLEPNTKYFYAIYDGNRRLAGADADHYFVTHRPTGSAADMRIWVVGDSGTGGKDQAMVHNAMRAYVAKTGRPVDHYVHVGDMAYSDGTNREFQRHFFAPYQVTLRNTVCWPTMGNHEGHTSRGISGVGPYYDAYVVPTRAEAGGVPSGTEAYYSFDISDVHFICLDSHDLDRSPNAAMAQWLRADLEQTRAKWLIAFWHHPPYTMGSHNSDRETRLIEMRENFMPILEAAGVDLTLTGHSHIYERSMLMDGAYATPTTARGVILDDGDGNPAGDGAYRKSAGLQPNEGSVAIVAGHGGTGLGREGTMPVMRQIILEHGSVILDIRGDTLTGTMLNKHGETRDLFGIVKRGKVVPTPVANPWQPVHDIALLTELRLDFAADTPGAMPEGWAIVRGANAGMAVAAASDGKRKWLRAHAGQEPMIAVFTGMPVTDFEYETVFRLPSGSANGAGLVFGYVDERNHGRVFFDSAAGIIRVSRIRNGAETILAERKAVVPAGEWIEIGIEAEDGVIEVNYQDDTLEFTAGLDGELPKGPVGIFLRKNSAAEFQMFVIEDEGVRS